MTEEKHQYPSESKQRQKLWPFDGQKLDLIIDDDLALDTFELYSPHFSQLKQALVS